MSALFGTGTQNAVPASSLNIQTSVQGIPIPIVYGKTRISGNLINYTDFTAIKGGSGGGKGGLVGGSGKGGSTYYYTVAVEIALCEGPIQAVPSVWNNQTQQSLSSLNLVALTGSYSQTAWGYEQSLHPTQALNYRGLARVVAGPLALGTSPALPNLSFVVHAAIADAVAGLPDADPSAVISDLLTNAYYGVGMPVSRIGDLSVYTAYCRATGLLISPAITDLTEAQQAISMWLEATNSNAVWSQGQLKVVPYGDQAITAGAVVQEVEPHTIPNPYSITGDPYAPPTIVLQFPGTFVADLGVTLASTGAAFKAVAGTPTASMQYQMPSPGTYVFAGADENTAISIAYSYTEPASYTPPSAPIYALGDDDFIHGGSASSDAPVQISRSAPQDQKNSIIVNYLDRSNSYVLTPTPAAKDDASIQLYGLRQDNVRDYHFFCYAEAAQQSAHLLLGRQLVRNTYSFTVDASFILLDPMDIISITDVAAGLNQQWVRITEIQENSDLTLTITAEDYLAGSAHAPLYGNEPAAGYQPNYQQDPGIINPPVIFEPPSTLTGSTNELWVGVSGASAVWGGCDVYVSYDDTTFTLVPNAHLVGPSRTGVLTAALPAATVLPDTNTLSIDISESIGAQLTSTTASDAAALATLSYVDGELLAYQTATLTTAGHYNLTGLVRGGYGSPASSHAIGAPFLRLNNQIIQIPYNKALVGQQIFLKFVSFNIWGQGAQSLANVQAYEYVFGGGQPPGVLTGLTASLTQSGLSATLIAAWAPDALSATYQAQVSSDGGTTWTTVYDGAQPGFRQDGLKAQVIQIRARGVTSTGIDGAWSTVTLAPTTSFSMSGAGYGSIVNYTDINPSLVDPILNADVENDLNELANFVGLVNAQKSFLTALSAGNAGAAAALQLVNGQMPNVSAAVAVATQGLPAQIAAANAAIQAQAQQEISDVANLQSQIATVSSTLANSTASTSGISATQANINLTDAITQDAVTVSSRINDDQSELTAFQNAVASGNLARIASAAVNGANATIVTTNYAAITSANATALSALSLAGAVKGSLATANNTLTVVASQVSAQASSLSLLTAQIGDPLTGLSAAYSTAVEAYTTTTDPTLGNAALSAVTTGLASSVAGNASAIQTLQGTTSSQGSTLATLQQTVSSNYNALSSGVSSNSSAIQNLQGTTASNSNSITTLANQYGSLSSQVTTAQATAAGISANGQIQLTAQSAPSGVTARFAATLSASGQASATGGFYLDLVNGAVGATFDVATFKVQSGSTRSAPFAISGGAVYLTGVTYVSSTLLSQTLTSGGATPNVSILQQDFVNGAISVYDNT